MQYREWDIFYKSDSVSGRIMAEERGFRTPAPYNNQKYRVREVIPGTVTLSREELEDVIERHTKSTGGYYSFDRLQVGDMLDELFVNDDVQGKFADSACETLEVERLCETHGYGRVMQIASDLWRKKDPIGALTVGPCAVFIKSGTVTISREEALEIKSLCDIICNSSPSTTIKGRIESLAISVGHIFIGERTVAPGANTQGE